MAIAAGPGRAAPARAASTRAAPLPRAQLPSSRSPRSLARALAAPQGLPRRFRGSDGCPPGRRRLPRPENRPSRAPRRRPASIASLHHWPSNKIAPLPRSCARIRRRGAWGDGSGAGLGPQFWARIQNPAPGRCSRWGSLLGPPWSILWVRTRRLPLTPVSSLQSYLSATPAHAPGPSQPISQLP